MARGGRAVRKNRDRRLPASQTVEEVTPGRLGGLQPSKADSYRTGGAFLPEKLCRAELFRRPEIDSIRKVIRRRHPL